MKLRHIYPPQVYFKAMWVFTLLLYILIPLQSGAVSLVYWGIILITFGCFFTVFIKRLHELDLFVGRREIICVILLVITNLLSLLLGRETINFDPQIMGMLGFIEMPLAILLMDSVDCNEENTKFVLYINIAIAAVFSVLSVTEYAYSGVLDSLYLGYANPNVTAIYLLLNQAVLLMFLPMLGSIVMKCLVIGLCVYEEYLMYLTDSRTCVAVSIILVLYYLFGKRIKIPRWAIAAVMVFPVAFLLLYTGLYASGKYDDLQILGKTIFSGREVFFLSQMDLVSWKNVLGDVRQYYFTNMHNGALAIIASCGMLGYILWFLFYFWTILRYYRGARSQSQCVALVAILGVFIHSCAEAALMVGGAHYSAIVATLYWILKGAAPEEAEEMI